MFGSEGERLQELRQQQAKKYAMELRQQIASKNSQKPKTPDRYSTTTSDHYSNPKNKMPNSILNQDENLDQISYRSNTINRNQTNPSQTTQSNQTQIPITQPHKSERSPRVIHEPLPEFKSTTIAPLNITLTSYHADPMPSLPRQQNYSRTDASTFNERMNSLESIVDDQRSQLIEASEASSRIYQHQYPQIETLLSDMQNYIDRFSNTEIFQRIRPISDQTSANRENLDHESREIKSTIESLKDTSSELMSTVPQFMTRFSDTLETIKTSCIEVKTDNNRFTDQANMSFSKIVQIENREGIVTETTGKHLTEFENFDQTTTSTYTSIQQTTGEMMTSVSSQLAREIKEISDGRDYITTSLYSQVSEVNQNVVDNITRLQNLITDLTSNFRSNFKSLQESIGSTLNMIQNEVDRSLGNLEEGYKSLASSTETNFGAIQTELVTTMETLKTIITQFLNMIESSLDEEARVVQNNQQEINDRFDQFQSLIEREMGVQLERLNQLADENMKRGIKWFGSLLPDARTKLIVIGQCKSKIDNAEQKLGELEKAFKSASYQVNDSNRRLVTNLNELEQRFLTVKNDIEDGFSRIERTIIHSSSDWQAENYLMREDLIEMEEKVNETLEKKISKIENQIGTALTNIAQITLKRKEEAPTISAAAEEIQKLADDSTEYSDSYYSSVATE